MSKLPESGAEGENSAVVLVTFLVALKDTDPSER